MSQEMKEQLERWGRWLLQVEIQLGLAEAYVDLRVLGLNIGIIPFMDYGWVLKPTFQRYIVRTGFHGFTCHWLCLHVGWTRPL